jgi:hypothetical protein
MFLAVWTLYAADRLLDTEDLEARHRFHQDHRGLFLGAILIASLTLAALVPRIPFEAMRLYLILGGLVFGYFVLIHATRSAHRLPKEIAVGIFFAAAIFIPSVSRRPDLRLQLLPSAILFAVLCGLNCLFIYAWEHDSAPATHPPHAATALVLHHLSAISAALVVAAAALVILDRRSPWPVAAAISISALLLLGLHLSSKRIAPPTLRAAADLVLLTPFLLLPLL